YPETSSVLSLQAGDSAAAEHARPAVEAEAPAGDADDADAPGRNVDVEVDVEERRCRRAELHVPVTVLVRRPAEYVHDLLSGHAECDPGDSPACRDLPARDRPGGSGGDHERRCSGHTSDEHRAHRADPPTGRRTGRPPDPLHDAELAGGPDRL